ncbi:MAG: MDR family MFS transporter, partial [Actinomycetota bacterium]
MDEPATRPSLRGSIRAMPGSAWVLFAGSFVNRLGTFVLPFITLYLTRNGFSVPQAGLAIAAYGLGGLLSQILGGLLADRIGRRNTIALSMLSTGALTLALWQAETLALIYPLMFGIGCMGELHRPAAGALIADLLPSEQRVTAFTLYRLFVNVGWAGGLALGGFLAERSFDLVFVGDAATSITFGVISLVALPHGTRTARHEEAHLPTARSSILADRGFLLFLGAVLITGAVYSQNVSTMPLHIRDAGYSASTYGLLQSLNGVIVALFELPVIAWTQRFERLRMVALGELLIGLAFATLLFSDTLPLLVAMVAVWTIGEMIESPMASAIAADRAPTHARGRYQSAFGSMFGIAWIFGPMLGTIAFAANSAVLWAACGVLGIVAATLSLAAGRHPTPV